MNVSKKTVSDSRDAMVVRVRKKLHRLVQVSGVSQRRIEEQNGFTRGYLSQVLKGHITLTVRHTFGVLHALGVQPEAFFHELFEDRSVGRGRWEIAEIGERMARYDAAMRELEERGLLTPVRASESPASGGLFETPNVEPQTIAGSGKAAVGKEGE